MSNHFNPNTTPILEAIEDLRSDIAELELRPLGLTRTDVEMCRSRADRDDEASQFMGSKHRSPFHSLADRIEALLPPEK